MIVIKKIIKIKKQGILVDTKPMSYSYINIHEVFIVLGLVKWQKQDIELIE